MRLGKTSHGKKPISESLSQMRLTLPAVTEKPFLYPTYLLYAVIRKCGLNAHFHLWMSMHKVVRETFHLAPALMTSITSPLLLSPVKSQKKKVERSLPTIVCGGVVNQRLSRHWDWHLQNVFKNRFAGSQSRLLSLRYCSFVLSTQSHLRLRTEKWTQMQFL